MNKNLTYSKKAKKGFVEGYFNKKVSDTPKSASASTAFVYDLANEQREFFKPIFANETQYLPNGTLSDSQVKTSYAETLDVVSNSTQPSTQSLTIPPIKQPDNLLLKGLVVGAGIFLVYQILED
jgi:hypothetical protein